MFTASIAYTAMHTFFPDELEDQTGGSLTARALHNHSLSDQTCSNFNYNYFNPCPKPGTSTPLKRYPHLSQAAADNVIELLIGHSLTRLSSYSPFPITL